MGEFLAALILTALLFLGVTSILCSGFDEVTKRKREGR